MKKFFREWQTSNPPPPEDDNGNDDGTIPQPGGPGI